MLLQEKLPTSVLPTAKMQDERQAQRLDVEYAVMCFTVNVLERMQMERYSGDPGSGPGGDACFSH